MIKGTKQPDFADLKTSLTNSRLQTKDNALYQTIFLLIERMTKSKDLIVKAAAELKDEVVRLTNNTFLTQDDESNGLPNARRLLAGTGITFDDTVPGERTINGVGNDFVVMTDGIDPAQMMSDGFGNAIYIPYTP